MAPELEAILDPRGAAPDHGAAQLAPRKDSLEGRRIGLLNNAKPNAAEILERVATLLEQRYGVADVMMLSKPSFAVPADDVMMEKLAEQCDAVIAGVGDCGSCSAATTADGVLLEQRGVPAVSIVTDIFRASSAAMAELKGFPGYRFVAVPHPIASLGAAELDRLAEAALPDVLAILGVPA